MNVAFDADGRITGITVTGVGRETGLALAYAYDAANRITSEAESDQPGQAFGYDALDRLTGWAQGSGRDAKSEAFAYDADSNRLQLAASNAPLPATSYGYAANSNHLAVQATGTGRDAKTIAFTYDATGNTLSDGTHIFTYDARGRMASVVGQDGGHDDRQTTFYGLNGLGQRILKRGAGVQIGSQNEYVFDEQGHLLGEYDAHGNVIEENVWLGDIPVAVMTGAGSDRDSDDRDDGNKGSNGGQSGVFYIAADNIGAPHVITDAKGKRVWEWQHDPFGNDLTQLHQVRSDFLTFDLRFPGQIADAESGLNYNMARDYNAALGRYVQSDPLGLIAGVNTYGYVDQNPLFASDPHGRNLFIFTGSVLAITAIITNYLFEAYLLSHLETPTSPQTPYLVCTKTNPYGETAVFENSQPSGLQPNNTTVPLEPYESPEPIETKDTEPVDPVP